MAPDAAREAVRMIQRGLAALGYDPGPADGIAGPRTIAAATLALAAGIRPGGIVGPGAMTTMPRPADAVILQGAAKHQVRHVVVHCSDTRPDWMAGQTIQAKRTEIRRWHMQDRGWADIGYHWLIDRDGTVINGRPETVIGAGVLGHNAGVIHICLIGGHGSAATDRFAQHFSSAQDVALRQMIAAVQMRTRIDRISGHNEWAAKACPGFDVGKWLGGA